MEENEKLTSLETTVLEENPDGNETGNETNELITESPEALNEILTGGSEFDPDYNSEEANADNQLAEEHEEDNDAQYFSESSAIDLPDQEGGAAVELMNYKINYLVPDDEELVNVEKIKSTVKRYIDNFYSEDVKKYKQLFKSVYQKYSSKRYLIDNSDTEIIVSKASGTSKESKNGKRDIVYEVSKPEYIFYNKENNLINMKSIISNKRQELQMNYQSLVNKIDVQPEEKKQFEKERKQFIDLLERYYTYNLYHHQINNISQEEKANIVIQELHGFLKDNAEKKFTLDGNLYTIDNTLIEKINANNSSRLNTYNDLIIKLQGVKSITSASTSKQKIEKTKTQKIIDEIKEYLKSSDENNKLNMEIKEIVKTQNAYVDYIISRVPNN
jgi:hypothetical protein